MEVTMYDVVVVGAGVAGLSAALILGRARRRVLVVDGGTPRNAPAQHAHGFLSRDGIPPLELLRLAREELNAYPSVEVKAGEVARAGAVPRGFSLTLTDGQEIEARKLILSTGVTDVLPEIAGLAELWGHGVYHCPYCHGWEVRDKRWAVLGDAPLIFERVALFRGWASDVVVLANGASGLAASERERLAALGALLDERRITHLERLAEDEVEVSFEDGSTLAVGGVFVLPHQVQRSPLAEALGCEMEEFAPTASRYVKTDAATGETSVRGVYAAGDMIGPQQSLILAAASGARAAYRLNHAMAVEDAEAIVAGASPAVA
jgi:thioredoxin reductase